jgi:hypothetical protein
MLGVARMSRIEPDTTRRPETPVTARSLVADEVRGLLAKRRIHISHRPETLGISREFRRRRLVVGDVPLDIDNLRCSPACPARRSQTYSRPSRLCR